MKIVRTETLISRGSFSTSEGWRDVERDLDAAISAVIWPTGSDRFTIYPEKGKKRGRGNGVKPIKDGLLLSLEKAGWAVEQPLDLATASRPGKLDAVTETSAGPFAVEWETGNISSSHRALNKMALGLLKGKLAGGALIVPSGELRPYLTDRVGNFPELEPYLDLWKSVPCKTGVLQVIVVEHDALSYDVPRIPKGTDGRALH